MTSLEFRAGILFAAQALEEIAAPLTMLDDGARKLCLMDAAEMLRARARARDLHCCAPPAGVDQGDMFGGAANV